MNDEKRHDKINTIVSSIYKEAIHSLKNSNNTSYQYYIPREYNDGKKTELICEFYKINMDEILTKLKTLFPNYCVTHAVMVIGYDNKLYDITKITDTMLPMIKRASEDTYILIEVKP